MSRTSLRIWAKRLCVVLVVVLPLVFIGLCIDAEFTTVSGSYFDPAMANAKQIGLTCKQYALDHDGNYPPSLDALIPDYLKDRSKFASPLMPSVPNGYIYDPGHKLTDPPNTVLLEDRFAWKDKFAPKDGRLVIDVDDSAQFIKAK